MAQITVKKNLDKKINIKIIYNIKRKNKSVGKFNDNFKLIILDKKLLNIYKKLGYKYTKSYLNIYYYFLKNITK